MGWWLASAKDQIRKDWIRRFDPRFWTVNFPRPMMAAVTTTAPDALRVDAVFYSAADLAGLIWEAEDRIDHPLLGYETARDFRGLTLRFRWRSSGVLPLDAVNGPVLTIEGRDAQGAARSWYVRLWNYATGAPDDAEVVLDFDALDGGFLLPAEADPVFGGDIDRMFVSLVPPGHTGVATPLAAPVEAWVEMSAIACEGVLAIGDAMVPAHGLRLASGFDDSYNITPARLLRNALHLGYRGMINHYVGMSHYFRLGWDAGAGVYLVASAGNVLNAPAIAWHRDFAARAGALGYGLILSLSYELLDVHCPAAWKQRGSDGTPALTGWVPPSALISPANADAMAYLQAVGRAFVGLAVSAGQAPRFQIGEPWWWVRSDGHVCLYDDAAKAAFGGNPPVIATVRAALSPAELALLDMAGSVLAASTLALRDAVRAEAAGCAVLLLFYAPQVIDAEAPELVRANMPAGWARPAFDALQLEDYDFVTRGDSGASRRAAASVQARLGYAPAEQHYFSGFVLNPEDRGQWGRIDAAAEAARGRGVAETFLWAAPQILRDGFVHFDEQEEAALQAFHDVLFPIDLGSGASVMPEFSTAVVRTASGHEQRNADWADARLHYDAGPGIRSEEDVAALIAFFRARRGAAIGFRFRDPFDDSSAGMTGVPAATDQAIGTGDGVTTRFALTKAYGEAGDAQMRRITRPRAGTMRVAVDGVERGSGWTADEGGWIAFDVTPAAGAAVTAGYRFDVPVRFAEDRLEVSLHGYRAGEMPSVPLVEIRED